MTTDGFRTENDSMGPMLVPSWALWGASTQRAVENFPISGRVMPASLIHAYGMLKSDCAKVNHFLGKLDEPRASAIARAAEEVASGELDRHFPVDVYQTGSGTSTNMNVNEVIANRASQLAGRPVGSHDPVHPNDHVNMGQSSNDTFPTTMCVASAIAIAHELKPAMHGLMAMLELHAASWDDIVKVGRTHLMDATPIRMGQVFAAYASQARNAYAKASLALDEMRQNLAIGGTAVGTGLNTHPAFGNHVAASLSARTGIDFSIAAVRGAAQFTRDSDVQASGHLKTIAVMMTKIANDIRWLGSGPRCGLNELVLPAIQPGSSIMPGKVNPVICESMIQVCCRVVGNDATITTASLGGVGSNLELNTAMPVIADALLESIHLLSQGCRVFTDKLLTGLDVNREQCGATVERSLMMCTSLAPVIGYDQAAKLAKEAFSTGRTIRDLTREKKILDDATLDRLLDPRAMTEPGGEGAAGG